MITFTCECGKQYRVKDELAGKRAKCSCGKMLVVPSGITQPNGASIADPKSKLPKSPIETQAHSRKKSLRPVVVIGSAIFAIIVGTIGVWSLTRAKSPVVSGVHPTQVAGDSKAVPKDLDPATNQEPITEVAPATVSPPGGSVDSDSVNIATNSSSTHEPQWQNDFDKFVEEFVRLLTTTYEANGGSLSIDELNANFVGKRIEWELTFKGIKESKLEFNGVRRRVTDQLSFPFAEFEATPDVLSHWKGFGPGSKTIVKGTIKSSLAVKVGDLTDGKAALAGNVTVAVDAAPEAPGEEHLSATGKESKSQHHTVLSVEEAKRRVGENCTIALKVLSGGVSLGGDILLSDGGAPSAEFGYASVSFAGKSIPEPGVFIRMSPKSSPDFNDAKIIDKLLGKAIEVTGKVEAFKYRYLGRSGYEDAECLQISLDSIDEIRVSDNAMPAQDRDNQLSQNRLQVDSTPSKKIIASSSNWDVRVLSAQFASAKDELPLPQFQIAVGQSKWRVSPQGKKPSDLAVLTLDCKAKSIDAANLEVKKLSVEIASSEAKLLGLGIAKTESFDPNSILISNIYPGFLGFVLSERKKDESTIVIILCEITRGQLKDETENARVVINGLFDLSPVSLKFPEF